MKILLSFLVVFSGFCNATSQVSFEKIGDSVFFSVPKECAEEYKRMLVAIHKNTKSHCFSLSKKRDKEKEGYVLNFIPPTWTYGADINFLAIGRQIKEELNRITLPLSQFEDQRTIIRNFFDLWRNNERQNNSMYNKGEMLEIVRLLFEYEWASDKGDKEKINEQIVSKSEGYRKGFVHLDVELCDPAKAFPPEMVDMVIGSSDLENVFLWSEVSEGFKISARKKLSRLFGVDFLNASKAKMREPAFDFESPCKWKEEFIRRYGFSENDIKFVDDKYEFVYLALEEIKIQGGMCISGEPYEIIDFNFGEFGNAAHVWFMDKFAVSNGRGSCAVVFEKVGNGKNHNKLTIGSKKIVAANGTLKYKYDCHPVPLGAKKIGDICFNDRGDKLAVVFKDKKGCFLNILDFQTKGDVCSLKSWELPCDENCPFIIVGFIPSNKYLITQMLQEGGSVISVWEYETGKLKLEKYIQGRDFKAVIDPIKEIVVVANQERVKCLDIANEEEKEKVFDDEICNRCFNHFLGMGIMDVSVFGNKVAILTYSGMLMEMQIGSRDVEYQQISEHSKDLKGGVFYSPCGRRLTVHWGDDSSVREYISKINSADYNGQEFKVLDTVQYDPENDWGKSAFVMPSLDGSVLYVFDPMSDKLYLYDVYAKKH